LFEIKDGLLSAWIRRKHCLPVNFKY